MTLEQLKELPTYKLCNSKEQDFLMIYLTTGGDMAKAVETIWPTTKIHVKARQLQKKPAVAATLDFINGEEKPTRENLKQFIWETIRNSTNEYVRLEGSKQIIKLEEFDKKPSEEEARREKLKKARDIDNGIK